MNEQSEHEAPAEPKPILGGSLDLNPRLLEEMIKLVEPASCECGQPGCCAT